MADLLQGFKNLAKTLGPGLGKFGKRTAIELFLEAYHDDIIEGLANVLSHVDPADVPGYVRGGAALPIPPEFFSFFRGFEEELEDFEETRLFTWIAEASPLIAAAIMDLDEEGIVYMLKLKRFITDSVKDLEEDDKVIAERLEDKTQNITPSDDSEEQTNLKTSPLRTRVISAGDDQGPKDKLTTRSTSQRRKRWTCEHCGESGLSTAAELAAMTVCPKCKQPA